MRRVRYSSPSDIYWVKHSMKRPSIAWWNSQSLERQFLLAGSAVAMAAMTIVGWLVTSLISESVTRNAGATTALYVDSIIAPLLPDIQQNTVLDQGVARALDETLGIGALGNRLVAFKLWRRDGTLLYSKDTSEIGTAVAPSKGLLKAWTGEVVSEFNDLDERELNAEGASGEPLLEIYHPVLQPWSGEVVAVSEFYEVAADLERDLTYAKIVAWTSVAGIVLGLFGSLYAIVRRGSMTIDRQRSLLKVRVSELMKSVEQNRALRVHVQNAAQRSTALNESHLRSIGADLHDGPAQLIALASLRLETDALLQRSTLRERTQVVHSVRRALDDAMTEIRAICGGLVLPTIEKSQIDEVVTLAATLHEEITSTVVSVEQVIDQSGQDIAAPFKICAFRFVQEALNNAFRHAGGREQKVKLTCVQSQIALEVSDAGPGMGADGPARKGLGLSGLRDRVESLGGQFEVRYSPAGTQLTMTLNCAAPEHQ